MHIHHEETEGKGRYWLTIEGVEERVEEIAELTYSKAGEQLIIIDHTGVPDEFRGKGLGVKLVEKAVKDARLLGKKIMPLCPFAKAQIERHPHWQDVLKGANP